MKDYDVNARLSVVYGTRSVSFLLTFVTCAVLYAGVGCNSQPPPVSKAVPGLFAADEVWAVTSPADDVSNGLFLIRGFGNTIEYIVFESGPPVDSQFDGVATISNSASPLTSVSLEPQTASVTLANGTIRIHAESVDIQGRNCKLDLAAMPCTPTESGSTTCALENLNVTMTVDGDPVVSPGASLDLVRLESCPKSLELTEQNPGWAIMSVPFLAYTFAMSSDAEDETEGSGTHTFPPLLIVQGTNDFVQSAADSSSPMSSPTPAPMCGSGESLSGSPTQGSVALGGSTLQFDLAMQQVDTLDEVGNVQIATPTGGVCTAAFKGQVTYCASWKGAAGGETGGTSMKLMRVDGAGHRHLPGSEQTGLNHVYVILGLPDLGAPNGGAAKSDSKVAAPSESP